jgi:hypothetical protein
MEKAMGENPHPGYEAVADIMTATTPATRSKMFGWPCLKIGSKAFACFVRESMVFKLSGAPHARAIALTGAHLFDPSHMGRAMKEWVVVPVEHVEAWEELARDALAYVGDQAMR